jgi:hypothetical protein
MGEMRNIHKISVGKPEGKSPLGRPGRRWEDDIGIDFREIGEGGVDWIHMAQGRVVVRIIMDLRVPYRRGIS